MLRINGGPANSGTKVPLKAKPAEWTCAQGHENKGYWVSCMTQGCREKRP